MKHPLQSTTIQGALIMLISGVCGLLNLDLDVGYLTEIINALVMLLGAIMTIYGRWKATGKISLRK